MANSNLQEPFQRVTAQEAKAMLERGGVQLVDVRQPGEYAAGRIQGALLLPVDALFENIDKVAEDQDVLFYCAVGVRSALACEIGAAMGRTRCYNLEGGMEAWRANNFPIETSEPAKKA